MSDYRVKRTDLTAIADAIRTKGGTSEGLSFPDGFVDAIEDIPSGGGSTLITKSITENGTYNASSDNADGYSAVTVAVPKRVVIGTFKGTNAGEAIDVSVPYAGPGYPVAGIIFPSDGGYAGDIAALAQKFAIFMFAFSKMDLTDEPTYNDNTAKNKATAISLYKYSDSDPTSSTTSRGIDGNIYRNTNASATSISCVQIRSATSMSVYIANTSYGFPKDIEFTYMLVYSE